MATPSLSLDALVAQLKQSHGDALAAVVLYGSAASGEAITGQSDVNVMVLCTALPLATMRSLGQTMRAWSEAGNPPVLEMTVQEWRTSADIFPMEYADILERHRVLHGTLPLEGITVRPEHLRLQLEQESMGKLLRLRRGVMVAGTDTAKQQELLRRSGYPDASLDFGLSKYAANCHLNFLWSRDAIKAAVFRASLGRAA